MDLGAVFLFAAVRQSKSQGWFDSVQPIGIISIPEVV